MAGTEEHTGGDAVVDVLEWAGVRTVFGIPSVHNLPIYDALARRGVIRAVTVRHEQAAAGAADSYARVTGDLGVFITSTGPGAANAMGGLLEAFVSGSPVLHLTGQIDTRFLDEGRGFIHEVPDQPAMLGSLSKQVVRATSPDEIARVVEQAARLAMSPPRGPVSVELPIDLQYAAALDGAWPRPEHDIGTVPVPAVAPAELDQATELISAARRPLIWAGGGAVSGHAAVEVAALARRIGAGVITSPNARGILPEDDPVCIGNLSWDPDVRALCQDADLLLGIGTRYQGPNTENWAMELPGNLVQFDIQPTVPARNYPATVAVPGPVRAMLGLVIDRLGEATRPPDPEWLARVTSTAQSARERLRSTLGGHEALLDALAPLLDEDTVVVKDSTIAAYTWGNRLLPVMRPRTAVMPNGFAIGLGLPHALGAAAAVGDSGPPVICMVGDGGFMLSAAELATIAQENLPVVVAIFNDGGYGILRNIQERQYERRIGVDLGSPDFCALSRSLGVEAERVDSPEGFGKAMAVAIASRRPYLVEVDLAAIAPMGRPYTGTSRRPTSGRT
jgi:acetolactate synthase-1/2/3 large subunit